MADFVNDGINVDEIVIENQENPNIFINPFKSNPHNVTLSSFRDARIYDLQIRDRPDKYGSGWEVQRSYARKRYGRWMRTVRKNPGFENFRRQPIEVLQTVEDEFGNVYVIRRKINFRAKLPQNMVRRNDGGKNRVNFTAQSVQKGINVDDQDFRPKMFTPKMGREISALRNKLGLTQTDLGKRINVDANVIRNIETGDLVAFNVQDPMVRSLAYALGIRTIKYQ